MGISVAPNEAKPPLIVDPDAVLSFPVTTQCFQMVAGWCCEIAKFRGAVQLPKFSSSNPFYRSKTPTGHTLVKPLGLRAAERPDHHLIVFRLAYNVKR
jgi:hypothetical protein